MSASELSAAEALPQNIAYMGCHFSSSGSGLSNLPHKLMPGAMVIIDDAMPPQGHDPELIAKQLTILATDMDISCFLLDFQRPNIAEAQTIANFLAQALPCPVGITPAYAANLTCPVFLPPPPLHVPLKKHIAPWKEREIWLELATETFEIKVSAEGSTYTPVSKKIKVLSHLLSFFYPFYASNSTHDQPAGRQSRKQCN